MASGRRWFGRRRILRSTHEREGVEEDLVRGLEARRTTGCHGAVVALLNFSYSKNKGKAPEDVHLHYLLLHDIDLIDSGGVELPPYESEDGERSPEAEAEAEAAEQQTSREGRRKGVPWRERD
ncbi:hypothetical protein KSP39_PZI022027 [Platanthera zijinensis]|uniref:Uncharacterized protein n=1 Tax=Platanthera zijinensis TaxID=2320716 RepID=A0AAP0AYN6_9ASPA